MVLIQRRVHGGDLALTEGVVQRVIEQLRRDAEARGGGAVIFDQGLQTVILLIAVDVGDDGNLFQFLQHARREILQFGQDCRRAG